LIGPEKAYRGAAENGGSGRGEMDVGLTYRLELWRCTQRADSSLRSERQASNIEDSWMSFD
jgi:hypothetical protein